MIAYESKFRFIHALPGIGKSTFKDTYGALLQKGHRLVDTDDLLELITPGFFAKANTNMLTSEQKRDTISRLMQMLNKTVPDNGTVTIISNLHLMLHKDNVKMEEVIPGRTISVIGAVGRPKPKDAKYPQSLYDEWINSTLAWSEQVGERIILDHKQYLNDVAFYLTKKVDYSY